MATQQIDDFREDGEQRESLWKRALIMIGFMIALGIGQTLVHLFAVLQFVALAFNKRPSRVLGEFGASLALWLHDVAAYQCMATEEKPFPWQPWPEIVSIDSDDEIA